MDSIRYPIGPFEPIENPSMEQIQSWIGELERTPRLLREAVEGLREDQLDTPYRPGGWTIRQVVHHMADNNMNAYFRFKRALTENNPLVLSYRQEQWAELEGSKAPIEPSLKIVEGIYHRFIVLLRSLEPSDFKRTMNSVMLGTLSLETAVQRFLWHDRHHVGQIKSTKIKKD
ncbi:putative metal-dependent hydrolase [Paenibacillus aurantius]|uniref:Metal-dependent hydrolase n=1 Tax=Paenibacillus aurantius TaxID=2918900 RepID=A0AA96LEV4_9BACL|nr:putative metal-dependent hydrolase [Paenibacillus aurantius]WNQ11948.1 putative metal-dependent hydrolase [Paenibacillus aurantius]